MIRTTLSILVLFGSLLLLTLFVADTKAEAPDATEVGWRRARTSKSNESTLRDRLRMARQPTPPAQQPEQPERVSPLRDPVWVPPAATPEPAALVPAPTGSRSNSADDPRAATLQTIREAIRELKVVRRAIDDSRESGPSTDSTEASAAVQAESAARGDGASDAELPKRTDVASGTDTVNVETDEPFAREAEIPGDHAERAKPVIIAPEPIASDSKKATADDLSPEMLQLRENLRDCLAFYHGRAESANDRSPWGIMHALISFGVDSEILVDGRRVNAASWLCWNGACRGMRMMHTRGDQIEVRQGPGYQGHQAQFLAILAQSRIPRDYPLRADGRLFTIQDLVEYEKLNCRPKTELTFSLIGLAHYAKSDEVWKSRQGQAWNVERLIREELAQPIVGAACGGTHRLMGFSYALRKRNDRGEPLTGQWLRAKEFIDSYHEYAFALQNPDGSFSTNWFEGRASDPGIERRLQTSGHILEWLAYSLSEDELRSPRTVRAVEYLMTLMMQNRHQRWEVGPRGHALRALALYDERVFAGDYGNREKSLAERREKHALR